MKSNLRKPKKCHLSVNVNKIATLRNSRGGDVPNLRQCTTDIISYGAEGITVHPRPDERHIRREDVYTLRDLLASVNRRRSRNRPQKSKIEYNIEGYPSRDFLSLIQEVRPDQVTLVPDPPEALTSNAGWKVAENEAFLRDVISALKETGTRISLFVDVFDWSEKDHLALSRLRPDRVELYTERFAKDYPTKNRSHTTKVYAGVARAIQGLDIDINAGHDLNLHNTQYLLRKVPEIIECSIGHALIAESLYLGLKKTVSQYLREMKIARTRPNR